MANEKLNLPPGWDSSGVLAVLSSMLPRGAKSLVSTANLATGGSNKALSTMSKGSYVGNPLSAVTGAFNAGGGGSRPSAQRSAPGASRSNYSSVAAGGAVDVGRLALSKTEFGKSPLGQLLMATASMGQGLSTGGLEGIMRTVGAAGTGVGMLGLEPLKGLSGALSAVGGPQAMLALGALKGLGQLTGISGGKVGKAISGAGESAMMKYNPLYQLLTGKVPESKTSKKKYERELMDRGKKYGVTKSGMVLLTEDPDKYSSEVELLRVLVGLQQLVVPYQISHAYQAGVRKNELMKEEAAKKKEKSGRGIKDIPGLNALFGLLGLTTLPFKVPGMIKRGVLGLAGGARTLLMGKEHIELSNPEKLARKAGVYRTQEDKAQIAQRAIADAMSEQIRISLEQLSVQQDLLDSQKQVEGALTGKMTAIKDRQRAKIKEGFVFSEAARGFVTKAEAGKREKSEEAAVSLAMRKAMEGGLLGAAGSAKAEILTSLKIGKISKEVKAKQAEERPKFEALADKRGLKGRKRENFIKELLRVSEEEIIQKSGEKTKMGIGAFLERGVFGKQLTQRTKAAIESNKEVQKYGHNIEQFEAAHTNKRAAMMKKIMLDDVKGKTKRALLNLLVLPGIGYENKVERMSKLMGEVDNLMIEGGFEHKEVSSVISYLEGTVKETEKLAEIDKEIDSLLTPPPSASPTPGAGQLVPMEMSKEKRQRLEELTAEKQRLGGGAQITGMTQFRIEGIREEGSTDTVVGRLNKIIEILSSENSELGKNIQKMVVGSDILPKSGSRADMKKKDLKVIDTMSSRTKEYEQGIQEKKKEEEVEKTQSLLEKMSDYLKAIKEGGIREGKTVAKKEEGSWTDKLFSLFGGFGKFLTGNLTGGVNGLFGLAGINSAPLIAGIGAMLAITTASATGGKIGGKAVYQLAGSMIGKIGGLLEKATEKVFKISLFEKLILGKVGEKSLLEKLVGMPFKFISSVASTFIKMPQKLVTKLWEKLVPDGAKVWLAVTGQFGKTFFEDIIEKVGGFFGKVAETSAGKIGSKIGKIGGGIGKIGLEVGKWLLKKILPSKVSEVIASKGLILGLRTLGKGALGKVLKKLPFGIGALVGLYMGWQRFKKGEYFLGLAEVASGLVSVIPGIGTVASLGIDALIALADISKGSGKEGAKEAGKEGETGGGEPGMIGKFVAKANDWIKEKASAVGSWIKNLTADLFYSLPLIGTTIGNWITGKNYKDPWMDAFGTYVTNLKTDMKKSFRSMFASLKDTFGKLKDDLTDMAASWIANIPGIGPFIANKMTGKKYDSWIGKLGKWFKEKISEEPDYSTPEAKKKSLADLHARLNKKSTEKPVDEEVHGGDEDSIEEGITALDLLSGRTSLKDFVAAKVYNAGSSLINMFSGTGFHDPVARKVLITSPFGIRNTKKDPGALIGPSSPHNAIDLAGNEGDPVLSAFNGVVTDIDKRFNGVIIKNSNGTFSRYLHLSKVNVKKGDKVKAGSRIGSVGGYGPKGPKSYHPHLHFAMADKNDVPFDPEKLFYQDWKKGGQTSYKGRASYGNFKAPGKGYIDRIKENEEEEAKTAAASSLAPVKVQGYGGDSDSELVATMKELIKSFNEFKESGGGTPVVVNNNSTPIISATPTEGQSPEGKQVLVESFEHIIDLLFAAQANTLSDLVKGHALNSAIS